MSISKTAWISLCIQGWVAGRDITPLVITMHAAEYPYFPINLTLYGRVQRFFSRFMAFKNVFTIDHDYKG